MNKKLLSLSLSLALVTNSTLPAVPYVERVRYYAQQGYEKAVQGKEKTKRLWFCFRNPSQCSQAESAQAKQWIYGTATGVVTAALLAAGIVIGIDKITTLKEDRILAEYRDAVASGNTEVEKKLKPLIDAISYKKLKKLK